MEQQGINDPQIQTDQPNNDPRTIVKLQKVECRADTPSGAAWCRKYEHPPAATPSDYAGIPDANNSPSVRTEYRSVQDVQTYQSGSTVTNFNKVLFLQLPSAIVPALAFKYDTSGARSQLPEDVIHNSSIGARQHLQSYSSGRLAYKSCTYTLNATDFNNQGTVSVAQFRPNVARYTYQLLSAYLKSRMHPKKFETLIRKISAPSKIKEEDEDDLEIISRVTLKDNVKSATVGNSFLVLKVGKIPVNSTDVAQLSPNADVRPAREGAFVVQRLSQPTTPYHDYVLDNTTLPTYPPTPFATIASQVLLEVEDPLNPTQYEYILLNDNYYASTGNTVYEDVDFFDMTCAWVHFEGLSVQPASTTATTVTPPYITVKSITGLEAQALPGSQFTVFQENCAMPDRQALDFAALTAHGRLDALPAKFNFWGALASGLLAAAPGIVSTLKSVFGKKETKEEADRTRATVNNLKKMVDKSISANKNTRKVRTPRTPKPKKPLLAIEGPVVSAPAYNRRRRTRTLPPRTNNGSRKV